MISQSEMAALRNAFVDVCVMLEKRYIPWLWTQGCRERVRIPRRRQNCTWSYLDCGDARRFVVASGEAIMAKTKKDRLRVHKEARRLARLGVGMPPTERTIADKRQKAPKYKKKLVAPDLN
jgi:hypothetical protein